jgi:serine phosphatase RsbU (regulator of sigma subunit)
MRLKISFSVRAATAAACLVALSFGVCEAAFWLNKAQSNYLDVAVALFVSGAAALATAVFVRRRITQPLGRLGEAARQIRGGEFARVETTGIDEVATLMEKFNETNAALKAKMDELELLNRELEQRVVNRTQELAKSYQDLQARQEVLQREIAVARRVQETIVPRSLHREKISIDVEYIPIMAIGGDMGIILEQANDRYDVVVGDVTGHGIGAALVVNRAYTLLSQLYAANAELDATFHRLDYFLAKEIADIGMFMTISACRFDLSKMSMEYGGGGHQPTILYRPSDGSVTELASRCGILGTGTPFCDDPPVKSVPLAAGDCVIMFTDGLVEAMNAAGEEFGQARLEETVRSAAASADGKNLAVRLVEAAKNFTGGYFQDDVLVLVVEIR